MGWRQLLLSLDGRISRHKFWTVFLLPSVALNIIVAMLAPPLQFNKCMFAFWAAALWPCIAVGAKAVSRQKSVWLVPTDLARPDCGCAVLAVRPWNFARN
jgi:uncharacterized membrane protein YhaH (DUF805 family)